LAASSASWSVEVWYFAANAWNVASRFATDSIVFTSWISTSQPWQASMVACVGLVSPEMTMLRSAVSKR
jgi:hypothetical protein